MPPLGCLRDCALKESLFKTETDCHLSLAILLSAVGVTLGKITTLMSRKQMHDIIVIGALGHWPMSRECSDIWVPCLRVVLTSGNLGPGGFSRSHWWYVQWP